ncbi:MAG: class I SAM-dependent methyltransferase [Phyllobacteriaceae bacterium]|nr:class I SAM-dependent methyltransferase [Phyllobacteriaceae bacterium]
MTDQTLAAIPAVVEPRANPYLDQTSIEFRFRARRFERVKAMIAMTIAERGHCDILDLGGTETYWRIGAEFIAANRDKLRITLVNPEAETARDRALFTSLAGDATDPALFAGRTFDLVHSNSVIEHVGDDAAMQRFAVNVRRLGRRYFVQTPNYWFPYEPHFRFPGFQYLPVFVRREMLRRFALGFFRPVPDRREAQDVIDHHRLVTASQMRCFFPDAEIGFEKFKGLNKSIMAVRDAAPARLVVDEAPTLAPRMEDMIEMDVETVA